MTRELKIINWICCWCQRHNNVAYHPNQCTNPRCLHLKCTNCRVRVYNF